MLAAHLVAAGLASAQPVSLPPGGHVLLSPFADQPVAAMVEPATAASAAGPAADEDALSDPAAPAAAPAATEQAAPAPSNDDDFLEQELKPASDPLEGVNRISFDLSWTVDRIVLRPLAIAYREIVPKPARDGLRNALTNLGEPLVFVNDLLQLRPGRALRTLARFVINSTIGLGGLFDIAKREPFYLAHHENSFGRTLGYYGVGPGPYLYIPILGPTTVRDLADNAQGAIWPGPVGRPFDRGYFSTTATAIDGIDQRERNDAEINAMFRDSIDKYASFRSNFLQDRKGEIEALKARKGQTRLPAGFDDPLIDPAATAEPER